MLDWIYSWFFNVENDAFFGPEPNLLNTNRADLTQLLPGFRVGTVLNLLELDEEQVKHALVSHVVNQMTMSNAQPTLVVLRLPTSSSAQQHLHRLIEHRAVSKTWVLLVSL